MTVVAGRNRSELPCLHARCTHLPTSLLSPACESIPRHVLMDGQGHVSASLSLSLRENTGHESWTERCGRPRGPSRPPVSTNAPRGSKHHSGSDPWQRDSDEGHPPSSSDRVAWIPTGQAQEQQQACRPRYLMLQPACQSSTCHPSIFECLSFKMFTAGGEHEQDSSPKPQTARGPLDIGATSP